VLRFGTEFSGWVFNSTDPDQIRQRVDPGNATYGLAGDLLTVNTPVGGDLLVDVEVTPVFTPNGDGTNDNLTIAYKLREVTSDRLVRMHISTWPATWSPSCLSWRCAVAPLLRSGTGRNDQGKLVRPGIYLYELSLESVYRHTRLGTFALAY